jgi:deoxyribodipyrimidine photo-lyase
MSKIIWHRRDLRLDDHPALSHATKTDDALLGVFIFDPKILQGGMTGTAQVAFMLGCLAELEESYRAMGSELLFFMGDAEKVLRKLVIEIEVTSLYFNQDVEPYAIERDRLVKNSLEELGIKVESFIDIGLVDPTAIATRTQDPYKVYTPYWRTWINLPKPQPYDPPQKLTAIENLSRVSNRIPLPSLSDLGFNHLSDQMPIPGESEAKQLLSNFCQPLQLLRYQQNRNLPGIEGTSRLSPHLRFGTIGIRRVWAEALLIEPLVRSDEERESLQTWQQELAWREFYQHILFHFPELEKAAYRPQMQRFIWDENQAYLEAWCAGKTGVPIVDAAMRQLNQTGWMHNRCRMIVASFLTKDLLINWQLGEKYFMQKLIDGDLAANNGGWQWSASSGMDPKPLRIFNPSAQAKKCDPQCDYIRQYLPEIARLTDVELITGNIHPSKCKQMGYPEAIVDHQIQQKIFKQRYQEAKL